MHIKTFYRQTKNRIQNEGRYLDKMIREIDKRNYHYSSDQNPFSAAGFLFNRETKPENIESYGINPVTGSPALLVMNNNEMNHESSLITMAIDAVQNNSSALGFSGETMSQGMEFIPDPNVITTSSNTSVVHLHQVYRGIPVYQMLRTCRFAADGTLEDIVGDNVNISEEINLIPEVDVESAMIAANEYINTNQHVVDDEIDAWGQPIPKISIDTSEYIPKVLVAFPTPARYTVLDKGEFEENIPAQLVIFPQHPKSRLAWRFVITLKETMEQYEIIVAADQKQSNEVLLCMKKSFHMKAQGSIFEFNGGEERKLIPFPRPVTEYPVKPVGELPSNFPVDWVNETETIGNNTEAVICDSNVSSPVDLFPSNRSKW